MVPVTAVALIAGGVFAIVVLEGAAWVAALVAERFLGRPIPRRGRFLREQSRMLDLLVHGPRRREHLHPTLGWEYRADYATPTDQLNAQGLRATREYAPTAPAGEIRIAAFGDSYVYCNEVANSESWPAQIEGGWHAEVLNHGVGGYGLDQALLRFREEGARFGPQVVMVGFTSVMASRVVSRYRRFQDPRDGPWFKPRFVPENGRLRLVPPPVRDVADVDRLLAAPIAVAEFGRDDFWYNRAVFEHPLYVWSATYRLIAWLWPGLRRRYVSRDAVVMGRRLNSSSEAFAVLTRILEAFVLDARAAGAEPAALMLPIRSDVEMFAEEGWTSYAPLAERAEGLGLLVIDPVRALTSAGTPLPELFASGGHYSAVGNAIVARTIAESLGLSPRS